ncbi:MAG: DUF2867 domain-containing protein [Roseobacter sp.]
MIEIEDNTHLLGPKEGLFYYDRQTIDLPCTVDPLKAWNLMISTPLPVLSGAFWIRDQISSVFGVKKIKGFSGETVDDVARGDYLDFFLVEARTPTTLTLTERDVHLDVMTCLSLSNAAFSITSSVIVHNAFGRAYMIPVGLAHPVIVKTMLRRLRKKCRQTGHGA